jgi:hypothetical protein
MQSCIIGYQSCFASHKSCFIGHQSLIATAGGKDMIPFVADKSVGRCLDGAVQVDVKLPTAYRKLLIAVLEF